MNNLRPIPQQKRFWDKVKEFRDILPDVVTLMSLDNYVMNSSSGSITDVPREQAARCLANQTHRLATPDEIADYQAECARKKAAIEAPGLEAKRHYLVLPDNFTVARTSDVPAGTPVETVKTATRRGSGSGASADASTPTQ